MPRKGARRPDKKHIPHGDGDNIKDTSPPVPEITSKTAAAKCKNLKR